MNTSRTTAAAHAMRSVTPFLTCAGAVDAIEFYKRVFDAKEQARLLGPQGKVMYSNLQIGDSAICVVDDFPEYGALDPRALKGTPVMIHLYVDDVDAVFARTVDAGAKVRMPVEDMFWGDRYGQLEDPFGHLWSIATHVREVSEEEMRQAMQKMADDSGDN
jgi:PhnB protein